MTLTKQYTQLDRHGNTVSTFEICVDYNRRTRTVIAVNYIRAYNVKERIWTDVSNIFLLNFPDQADAIIDSIDWSELAAEREAA